MRCPRAPPDGTAAPSRNAAPSFPGTGVATTCVPGARTAAQARARSAAVSSCGPPYSHDPAGRRQGDDLDDVRRHLAHVDRLRAPAHRHREHRSASGGVEQEVDEVVELGDPEQGHRQARGEQHLLGGELRAVVAVGDLVDADDRHVDEVPQPVAVDGLDQPPGARDVDLPGIPARVAGRVHDHLGTRRRVLQVPAGREISADAAGAGAPARHLPDRVAGALQWSEESLTQPPGPTGDEYVHVRSLACPASFRQPSLRQDSLVAFHGVLFDWRGTLVVSPTFEGWVAEALRRLGRPADHGTVGEIAARLERAGDDLDAPGMDADPALHRRTYLRVLADLGLDPELVDELYEVESDPAQNPFADDAAPTLRALRDAGLRIGVVSDIHVDIRPSFAAAGLEDAVDVFTLSFEQGVQKPDPEMFTRTLDRPGHRAGRGAHGRRPVASRRRRRRARDRDPAPPAARAIAPSAGCTTSRHSAARPADGDISYRR